MVCNPPYIPTGDLKNLDPSVRDHEPLSALDGGGTADFTGNPQEVEKRNPGGGFLMFEVGIGQAEEVKR